MTFCFSLQRSVLLVTKILTDSRKGLPHKTNMNTIKYFFAALLVCSFAAAQAQGLDGIVVERYYQANAADVSDATTQGAVVPLTTASVTYRVYVDMAAGYKFSQIYGSSTHPLTLSATANFYNDPNWGVSLDPGLVTTTNIRKNTGMIDSYFTTGGTAVGKVGVRKIDDTDGSLGNAQSILANNPASCFGAPINGSGAKDGMATAIANTYLEPNALGLGAALDVLDQTAGSSITINDGAIAALGGVVGATADNLVLIGQFTTTGSLSFSLNVQLINIATGVAENFVSSSPVAGELTSASLTQTIAPTCPVIATSNDSPDGAVLVSSSTNSHYPNCYPINGTTVGSTDSPESAIGSGPDRWYRFVALSSGVSITLTSAGNDDVIELFEKVGANYVLLSGGTENASAGIGDFERLNFTGLTPGAAYYASVGAASGSTGGTFSLCIQHLMPGACAYTQPVGGYNPCGAFKSIFRGSPSSGVTYAFNFAGVGGGATETTTVSGTNGLITLSNPTLALRYAGVYDVTINISYALQNSASTPEVVTVVGTPTGNCNDVTIAAQPNVEVRSTQRCPATIFRGNYLNAARVAGAASVCGAINYTFEFTPVVSCADGTSAGLPLTFTSASTYLQLNALPNLSAPGAWDVRVRPNFAYGNGAFGPTQRILVSGTAASGMLADEEVAQADVKALEMDASASIYPNPSNGSMIVVNYTDLTSNQVQVRIMDAMGREVFRSAYSVDGSLNQILTFDQTLAAGVYMVELTDGTVVVSERMIVKN